MRTLGDWLFAVAVAVPTLIVLPFWVAYEAGGAILSRVGGSE